MAGRGRTAITRRASHSNSAARTPLAGHTQSRHGDWRRRHRGRASSQLMETWKFVSFRRRWGPVRRATGRRTGLWGTRLYWPWGSGGPGVAASAGLLEAVEGCDGRALATIGRRRCEHGESHADCEAHCAKARGQGARLCRLELIRHTNATAGSRLPGRVRARGAVEGMKKRTAARGWQAAARGQARLQQQARAGGLLGARRAPRLGSTSFNHNAGPHSCEGLLRARHVAAVPDEEGWQLLASISTSSLAILVAAPPPSGPAGLKRIPAARTPCGRRMRRRAGGRSDLSPRAHCASWPTRRSMMRSGGRAGGGQRAAGRGQRAARGLAAGRQGSQQRNCGSGAVRAGAATMT